MTRPTAERLRAAGSVFAEDEARLLHDAATSPEQLTAMVERRVAGQPLEHILGWAEFAGLRIAVEPGVFVPRRRTEHLVREAAARGFSGAVVVDLCCGSGAVGVAVATLLGEVELYSADIDPVAVRCARRNVGAIGGQVYEGDLDGPLPPHLRGHVDILVANLPYVPTGDLATMPSEARVHEPRAALDGGPDGLDVLRRVAAVATTWLAPSGCLAVETSERQAATATEIVARAGLSPQVSRSPELAATVLIGTRPSIGR
jgi:release factor glutamine methyltransferase